MGKESALTIKKYCIKIESLEEESQTLRKKLEDRDDHILRLKHEVVMYNESVEELTKSK